MKRKIRLFNVFLCMLLIFCLVTPLGTSAAVEARYAANEVVVNGKTISFAAYNIGGANYFKLRDLAYVLSGTEKQFSVGWDGERNAVSLTSGKRYTAVGGELAVPDDKGDKTANETSSEIYLNGKRVSFSAYSIGGENYFKLRDVMKTFDVGVTWNSKQGRITLSSAANYVEEKPIEKLDPPQNVFFKILDGSQVGITCDPVGNADGYYLYYGDNKDRLQNCITNIYDEKKLLNFDEQGYLAYIDELEGKTTYFKIAAVKNGKEMSYSEVKSLKVPPLYRGRSWETFTTYNDLIEKEENNIPKSANPLPLMKRLYGAVSYSSDPLDFYQIYIPEKRNFRVTIYTQYNYYIYQNLKVVLTDTKGNAIQFSELVDVAGLLGQEIYYEDLPAGEYRVCVWATQPIRDANYMIFYSAN